MRALLRQQGLVCRSMLAKHIPNGFQFGGQRIEHGVLPLQVLKSADQNGADLLLIKHNGTSLGFIGISSRISRLEQCQSGVWASCGPLWAPTIGRVARRSEERR